MSGDHKTVFVDVLLPVPVPRYFTYQVPDHLTGQLEFGFRVIVQFGRKILTGIIWNIHEKTPEHYKARYLLDSIDQDPVISPPQKKLFEWLAEYYMCTPGEVMNAALPTGLKLSSESKIQLHPEFNPDRTGLTFSDTEWELIKSLEFDKSLTYPQAAKILDIKNIYHVLKSLLHKEVVILFEEIREKYQPKKEKMVRIVNGFLEEENALEGLFETLEKHPKQVDILLTYLKLVPIYDDPGINRKGVSKSILLKNDLSRSSYETLKKNGILEEFEITTPRFTLPEGDHHRIVLSEEQEIARKHLSGLLGRKETVLLHGITGSGKTEIYLTLIQEYLEQGKQVLYLLPEIALTTQIVERLIGVFGTIMGVYHSKYSDNERVEVWHGVRTGRFQLVLGVRSAVFLPFDRLGLIIIDEEQENSFKQTEPAPRYHARDTALYLSFLHGSKTLLGSATPSLESYYLAKNSKYGYVQLKKRYGPAVLPEIRLVNIRLERKNKTLKSNFSTELLQELEKTCKRGKQSILFQNRRGYSPFVICDDCGWIPQCRQCSVSLTYHMYSDDLRCHYCGFKNHIPAACPACGSTKIRTVGFGTEKIEDDLKIYLPEARLKRMDLDTTRSRYSYQKILHAFDSGETDILIGTQMITKGLDFGLVTLVGIMDADRMMYFPDFRSAEKAFQMIVQVSGRAGRRDEKGMVLIQTSNPDHELFEWVRQNDYEKMAAVELQERKNYGYPPFTRIIDIIIRHKDRETARKIAQVYTNEIRPGLGEGRILGPEEPLISKIRNEYLFHILIKLERDKVNLQYVKSLLYDISIQILNVRDFKSGRIHFNVDPV
ncbi:MAG: primosomal protein N' [Cyclobacteriaceae bacterium]|nr:primosomal protein N' [Cyclobacteriaceae bacterium]